MNEISLNRSGYTLKGINYQLRGVLGRKILINHPDNGNRFATITQINQEYKIHFNFHSPITEEELNLIHDITKNFDQYWAGLSEA